MYLKWEGWTIQLRVLKTAIPTPSLAAFPCMNIRALSTAPWHYLVGTQVFLRIDKSFHLWSGKQKQIIFYQSQLAAGNSRGPPELLVLQKEIFHTMAYSKA